MLPFRDRLRAVRRPWLTWALVALNLAAFAYELSLGPEVQRLFAEYGVVPSRLGRLDPAAPASWVAAAPELLISMFLHGGWLHLLLNLWFLWIFGDNVEDRLGPGRYLTLYLASGTIGALAHVYANPASSLPTVGASGAIAGVLGAYAVTFPGARVLTLVPILFFIQIVELPAWVLLGVWFLLQFLSGTMAVGATQASAGGVAWWAHIGGFVAGAFLMLVLRAGTGRRRRG